MGIFDRWTSAKGKAKKVAPTGKQTAKEREQAAKEQAFAAVPGSQATAPKKVSVEPNKAGGEKAVAKKTPAAAAVKTKESTDQAYRVLLNPIITEKTSGQTGQYTFTIKATATKSDVRNAVHQVYGLRPISVNITSLPGKPVRYGRHYGRTIRRKKAVVTLPAGKTIEILAR